MLCYIQIHYVTNGCVRDKELSGNLNRELSVNTDKITASIINRRLFYTRPAFHRCQATFLFSVLLTKNIWDKKKKKRAKFTAPLWFHWARNKYRKKVWFWKKKYFFYSSKCKVFFSWKPVTFGRWFTVLCRKTYSVQDQILKSKHKLEKKL